MAGTTTLPHSQRLLSTVFLLLAAVCSFAQGNVSGVVVDEERTPLGGITVALLQNGTPAKPNVATGEDGTFRFDGVTQGRYAVRVAAVGYSVARRAVTLTAAHSSVRLDTIVLATRQLGEALVQTERPAVRLEADRRSYGVDQQIAATGGTATEVLENIPSIEVDQDGNISLRGNTSVEVWINGRPSGLTADNRGDILEQLPAETIERIEVIDNPPAKYSAEGSAGIINIVLKQNSRPGYYGSVSVGGNTDGGANASANINYSSGKVEAFANIGLRHRRNHRGGSWSEQLFPDLGTFQNSQGKRHNQGNNLFARAGVTLHATKHDDFTLGGNVMVGGHNGHEYLDYQYGSLALGQQSTQRRVAANDGDMHMYHAEFVYKHTFSEKHFLEATAEYNRWMMDNDNVYQDSTWYADGTTPTDYSYQLRPDRIRNRSWEFRLDYENQISDAWKLQAGYNGRLSHENTPQHTYLAPNWNGTGLTEDEGYFNRFIYDQDTHALYTTLTWTSGAFSVQGGLRGEYWKVNTESYNFAMEHDPALRGKPFKKDYFQLFPSLFVSYQLTSSQQLQLNYTRRLRRPWGGQLNSFRNTRDATVIEYGNPQLTPEYSNNFTLNYIKTWDRHTLSLGAYYRPTTEVIQRIRYRSEADGMMYMTSCNVTKRTDTGIEVVAKNKLLSFFDLTTTANLYYQHIDGFDYVIDGQHVTGESDHSMAWSLRLMGMFQLPADFSLQATGNLRSRQVVAQGYRRSNYNVDLGLRKTFLHRQLALSLSLRDVFNSRKFRVVTESDLFTRHQKGWRGGRSLQLTLTWNFGNMKRKPQPRRDREDGGDNDGETNSYTGDSDY
ncbi:MAG: TonB-dependent receptor [Bacteroidaceae bacterium]|nr:TonB-dependent receptor [Bacteroidaceae bacterium]